MGVRACLVGSERVDGGGGDTLLVRERCRCLTGGGRG